MKDLKKIKNFLLDMDGTIYLGDRLFDVTPKLLDRIAKKGGRAVFLTNNSSKSGESYLQKLKGMGLEVSLDDFFTSGDATAITLKKRYASPRVYLIGTPSLERQFLDYGIELVKDENDIPDCVVLGFDLTLTYEKIRIGCKMIAKGAKFIATHPDRLCPAPEISIPDVGSMIKMFTEATGVVPEIMGKPEQTMASAVFERYGFAPDETAMVGDRLSTDIRFANNSGITAIAVLTGETTAREIAASVDAIPDFVFASVGELADEI